MNRSSLTIIGLSLVALVEAYFLISRPADPPVATFAGQELRQSQLDERLRQLYGERILQELITERLIDKSIAQAKVGVTPEELDSWVADYKLRPDAQELIVNHQLDESKLRENLSRSVPLYKLILAQVPESERKRYFEEHRAQFQEMELLGILLGSEAEAKNLAQRIKGEDSFAAMALVHSLDIQTRDIGGRLGRVTLAELQESFDPLSVQELMAQKVGYMSPPLASNSGGWYLFWIKSRSTEYADLRLRVIERMASERLPQFLESLRQRAEVKILLPQAPSLNQTEEKKS